jgi:hypothetical protein
VGYDTNWNRWIGYGVPAFCDHPGCVAEIDRGIGYVCGGEVYGGDDGCGLYFCPDHRHILCERCESGSDPFDPTPDTREWIQHMLTDESWASWRRSNPAVVTSLIEGAS